MIQPLTLDTTPMTFDEKVVALQSADACRRHMWRAVEAAPRGVDYDLALSTYRGAMQHYMNLVAEYGDAVWMEAIRLG